MEITIDDLTLMKGILAEKLVDYGNLDEEEKELYNKLSEILKR